MVREAPAMQYDAEQRLAANEGGFGLLERLTRLEAHCQIQDDKIKKLESHRQSHLDIRQRAISTWVRDALHRATERQNEEIRRLNKDVIHGGDVRSDAMVLTERYKKSSTEWRSFRTLYGLTPDEVNDLVAGAGVTPAAETGTSPHPQYVAHILSTGAVEYYPTLHNTVVQYLNNTRPYPPAPFAWAVLLLAKPSITNGDRRNVIRLHVSIDEGDIRMERKEEFLSGVQLRNQYGGGGSKGATPKKRKSEAGNSEMEDIWDNAIQASEPRVERRKQTSSETAPDIMIEDNKPGNEEAGLPGASLQQQTVSQAIDLSLRLRSTSPGAEGMS
ncbi:hypothetical protein FQN53_002818 [Emmonsiellopsis sp. PD_33]|nr:hypothetical protein FQN53_002818 [Emmonsiellopsis sp. PD_33]